MLGSVDNKDARLTNRETQIAEMIAWGASKKDVANRLFLSVRTVENHIRNIYDKIGIQKANELSAWWFCKRFGIDPSLSPLKKILVVIFIGLIIKSEIMDNSNIIRTRTRTETRSGRRRSENGENDLLLDF